MTDRCLANLVNLRQFGLVVLSAGVQVADMFYLFIGKFCVAVILVFWLAIAPFGVHIFNIIQRRTKPKMSGIAAKPIIARMADIYPIGDRSILEEIRKAVSGCEVRTSPELTVAVFVGGGFPIPALIRGTNSNFFPETFWRGAICRHLTPRLV